MNGKNISGQSLNHIVPQAARASRKRAAKRARRQRSQEGGFAFLLALGMIVLFIAMTLVVLQNGATEHRRMVEDEAIWRGNQYARAIRLYFHKTGHYPQDLEDLQKGLPEMHFLRQAYKDPTNPSDGSWRFVYVNAAGQIIGSTKYANLQQMALMDANGGQLPTIPGAPGGPGVPASSLGDPNNNLNSQPGQTSPGGIGTDTSNPSAPGASGNVSTDGQNPQSPDGQNPTQPTGQNPQNPQSPQNPAAGPIVGQNPLGNQNPLSALQGTLGQGGAVTQASLAAMAQLKPTGPVDGPVLGAFLTGVACKEDLPSQKVYHGGKKYLNWEFIWNPLEDAAAAMQQQAGNAGANGIGQNVNGAFGSGGSLNGNPGQPTQQPSQPTTTNPQFPQ
ncbi:MAG: hypothetical protein WCA15_03880 [Candidatus Acidiferrales bacterium]